MTGIKKGKGPATPKITSSHNVTKKAGGKTRDKAKFDNERVRYDWDVYTDAKGDRRGKVGVGHDDGTNDIYGKVEFHEGTGHVKGTIKGERHINENLDARATYGSYGDGDQFGEVGATVKGERGSLDVDVGANERTDRVYGKVGGKYKVSDSTTLRGKVAADNKKSPSVTVGVDHEVGAGVTLHETLKVDHRGVRTHTHGVDKVFEDRKARIGAEVEHDSQGRVKVSADAGLTTDSGKRHEANVSWGRSKDDVHSGRVGYEFDDRDGLKVAAKAGFKGEDKNASLDVERDHDDARGSDKVGLDWSTNDGWWQRVPERASSVVILPQR